MGNQNKIENEMELNDLSANVTKIIDSVDSENLPNYVVQWLKESYQETVNLVSDRIKRFDKYNETIQKIIQISGEFPWAKTLAASMLVLAGFVLIGLSVVFAITTFGAGTPLSTPMTILGVSAVAAGLVLGGAVGFGGAVLFDDIEESIEKRKKTANQSFFQPNEPDLQKDIQEDIQKDISEPQDVSPKA